MRSSQILRLLLVSSVFAWATVEHGETEAVDNMNEKSTSGCFKPFLSQYEDIFREAFEVKLGDNTTIYTNCMSFDSEGLLNRAVVSGRNETETAMVFEFVCKADVVVAFPLDESVFSTERNNSCVECVTTGPSACVSPCAFLCERCYEDTTMCSRCRAEMRSEEGQTEESQKDCYESGTCPQNEYPNPANDNICECKAYLVYDVQAVSNALDGVNSEEAISEEEIESIIERMATCEMECLEGYNRSTHGNGHICYACGIQFCTECHEAEGEGEHDECTRCLPHTALFEEEECLAGIRAEIFEVFEEQEAEVEEEERINLQARLDLAISLPIVCSAVILFFIIMSFIAHKRYPHIGQQGEKRHRKKQEAVTGEDVGQENPVFQPRPTIRLR